ncbi:MAG: hypothetical protein J6W88_03375 [Bacteroidales bacterium]|nr:hypothetical protein [Bacteroidales bacterium]
MEYKDLEHVLMKADEDNADLHKWCARRRRVESVRRISVASCVLVWCCLSYSSSIGAPQYDQITTTGQEGNEHVCEVIQLSIEALNSDL